MDDLVTLSADVGGTNLNLGLLAGREGRFRILLRRTVPTGEQRGLLEPARAFLQEAGQAGLPAPSAACACGAGPVEAGRLELTNAPWGIDGPALERSLGLPVLVVNDFTALARGVLLLDPSDPAQLLPLPHPDGRSPQPDPAGTALVVGAGTGLGVGCVVRGPTRVLPSEGGHIGLPILDGETLALWEYLRGRFPGPPGAEAAVSGPGIATLLDFLVESGRTPRTPGTEALRRLPGEQRPAAIAAAAAREPACARALDLFVELYARVCADLCAVFLPSGGLYLAGGIAARHEGRFLAGDRFMRTFSANYRPHLDALARSTPVRIVRDYSVSLLGAADACAAHVGGGSSRA